MSSHHRLRRSPRRPADPRAGHDVDRMTQLGASRASCAIVGRDGDRWAGVVRRRRRGGRVACHARDASRPSGRPAAWTTCPPWWPGPRPARSRGDGSCCCWPTTPRRPSTLPWSCRTGARGAGRRRHPCRWRGPRATTTRGARIACLPREPRTTSSLSPGRRRSTRREFTADIARVLAHITAGDTYQVNYTFPLTAPFPHDPWAWFQARARQARVPFAACIDTRCGGGDEPVARVVRRTTQQPSQCASDEGHRAAWPLARRGPAPGDGARREREGARRERDDRGPAPQRHRPGCADRFGARLRPVRTRALSDRVAVDLAHRRDGAA